MLASAFSPASAASSNAAHATVTYGSMKIDGLTIADGEAGDPASPKLVLLHGFPASSHQYRNLIVALGPASM